MEKCSRCGDLPRDMMAIKNSLVMELDKSQNVRRFIGINNPDSSGLRKGVVIQASFIG